MLLRFFRVFIISIFLSIILILILIIYGIKKFYSTSVIKYNLINTINQQYGVLINFEKVEYSKPDNFIIRDLNLTAHNFKLKSQYTKLNIDIFNTIINKNFNITPQNIEFIDMKLTISSNKEGDIVNDIRELFSNLSKLNLITIKNSKITIQKSNNTYINIEASDFKSSKSLLSDSIDLEFDGKIQTKNKTFELQTTIELSQSYIDIKKLTTQLLSKTVELSGKININQNLKSDVELKIKSPLDLKDFINIPKSIKIEPTKLNLNIELKDKFAIINSQISNYNSTLNLKYNLEKNSFEEIILNSRKINAEKLKNYIEDYIKNIKGEIDLKITYKNPNFLNIEAESKDFSFTDKLDVFKFKDTDVKLLITKKFYALNIIKTKTTDPQWKINGGIHIVGDNIYETIETNLKINNKPINSKIKIKNIHNKSARNYEIDLKTNNFSLKEALSFYDYIKNRMAKTTNNEDSIYNFIDKKLKLKLVSDGYLDEPYILGRKLILNINYKKANEILKSDAEFKVKILEGQIKNIQQNIRENKTYELIFLPLTQLHRLNRMGALKVNYELKTINFYEIGSYFKANNGKIIVDKFYLNSVEFLIYSKGEIDFNSKTLDMEVYVINRKDYKQGALPETLTDAKGRPSLAFRVSGKFDKNEIKIIDATNITTLVENEIKKSIDIEE